MNIPGIVEILFDQTTKICSYNSKNKWISKHKVIKGSFQDLNSAEFYIHPLVSENCLGYVAYNSPYNFIFPGN